MYLIQRLYAGILQLWARMDLFKTLFNRDRNEEFHAQSPSSALVGSPGPVNISVMHSHTEAPVQAATQLSKHSPESEPANPVNSTESPELHDPDKEEQASAAPEPSRNLSKTDSFDVDQRPPVRPLNADHSTSGAQSTSVQLRKRLQKARIEYPPESHNFFVPNRDKNEIVTERVVMDEILAGNSNISTEQAQEYAKQVCSKAKNLFAVLAYMEKGAEVCAFLDENISDEDFPFERSRHPDRQCDFSLQLVNGTKVEVMEKWDSPERETFGKAQWLMLAPTFKDKKHYTLHRNAVLPFIRNSDEQLDRSKCTRGGYSEVFFAQIHSSHCWAPEDQHPNVAIKKLLTNVRKDFENERDILMKLGCKSNPHPHLVKLLASYEIDGEFFLIFPRAKCNLRNYWEKEPNPTFDQGTLLWSLRQMMGIAQALNTVHNFKVTYPLDHKGKNPTPQKGVKLSVTPEEAQYGRHGDIKPENIIFFEQGTGHTDDPKGILQITDFGLGRFHGRDSKTEKWPHHIFGSPTYEPPECKLFKNVSRVYDLWSLGCLYLEFATWLLRGSKDVAGFAECRARQSTDYPSLSDDLFFTITKDEKNVPLDAKVRKEVEEWVDTLHEHANCSEFIHQLLDLVMNDLLRIDAPERIPTSFLCVRFKGFYDLAMSDTGYLCDGKPQKPADLKGEAPRALSESAINLKSDFEKLAVLSRSSKRVSFSITTEPEEIRQTLRAYTPPVPGSILTPRKILKSATWPPQIAA